MLFKTLGDKSAPAVLFFHAMGVTGESSEPVAAKLADRFFCVMPTSTVYCAGQTYAGKADEVRRQGAELREPTPPDGGQSGGQALPAAA